MESTTRGEWKVRTQAAKWSHTAGQQTQLKGIPPIQREFEDAFVFDDLSERRLLRFQQGRRRADLNCFRNCAGSQLNADYRRLVHLQRDSFDNLRLKTGELCGNLVRLLAASAVLGNHRDHSLSLHAKMQCPYWSVLPSHREAQRPTCPRPYPDVSGRRLSVKLGY
jgi:hypothetical protein